MTTRQERIEGALLGQLVADAAARPLHWVYDSKAMDEALAEHPAPFYPRNVSPFYEVPLGHNTVYADEARVMRRVMEEKGGFSREAWYAAAREAFGPGSDYDAAMKKRAELKKQNPDTRALVQGPWLNATISEMLANGDGMVNGKESDAFTAVVPVVVLQDDMAVVEDAVRSVSHSDLCVSHAMAQATLLRGVLDTGDIDLSLIKDAAIAKEIEAVRDVMDVPHREAARQFGIACPYPGTFQSAVHALLKHGGSFEEAVTATIPAGGCNASRCNFIGAILGAKYGVKGIPSDWVAKTTHARQ